MSVGVQGSTIFQNNNNFFHFVLKNTKVIYLVWGVKAARCFLTMYKTVTIVDSDYFLF